MMLNVIMYVLYDCMTLYAYSEDYLCTLDIYADMDYYDILAH